MQGDSILEQAVAELLDEGLLTRHLRKEVRVYERRRDQLCALLMAQLPQAVPLPRPWEAWPCGPPLPHLLDG